jgi:hypothetical protein
MSDAASAALALSFNLQRVANVPQHPSPLTRLMSCARIANRRLPRIIGARWFDQPIDHRAVNAPTAKRSTWNISCAGLPPAS